MNMTAPAATTREEVIAMTGSPTYLISRPAPAPDAPAAGPTRSRELAGQCPRCGAAGTHYLTCPSLRLPPGYRLTEDLEPECAGRRGEHHGIYQTSRVFARPREGQPGGPDHPDWPRRPQH
jgi:hypothetical protein